MPVETIMFLVKVNKQTHMLIISMTHLTIYTAWNVVKQEDYGQIHNIFMSVQFSKLM